ncbi:MAG: DMT family transporter [Verrucomicrobiota bacterium]
MTGSRASSASLATGLVTAIVLWGGNNVALKQVVSQWPPLWTGSTRFLLAGLLLTGWLRWSPGLARPAQPPARLVAGLWWRGGLSLAVYIAACNWTLRFIPASHFALDMATSPVWALLLEGAPRGAGERLRRWGAATLAFAGVLVLLRPSLHGASGSHGIGELLGLGSAFLWTLHNRQTKALATGWSGAAVTAHSMWRAGVLMLPVAVAELLVAGRWPAAEGRVVALHLFCITLGGVVPFALWNHALAHWPVSRVTLFGNLIPLSTMAWAAATLSEPFSPTFGLAMALILAGVLLGQTDLARRFTRGWSPEE